MRTSLALVALLPIVLAGCNGAASPNGGSTSSAATKTTAPTAGTPSSGTPAPKSGGTTVATPSPAPSATPAPASSTGAAAVMAMAPLPASTQGTATYTVDPSRPTSATSFATLSALLAATTLKPDDIVEVATASPYSDIVILSAQHSGSTGHPVVIRAKPGAGYATWDASLMDAATRSRLASRGFFWQLDGTSHDIEICGVEIKNLPNATAAAGPLRGVFFLGSHCSFHHGWVHDNGSDGFMSTGLDTRVESCDVSFNGAGDGYTHNFYMEGTGTHIRFNHIHDAQGGINYKDRSVPDQDGIAVEVAYNWIENAVNGGYELDFSQNGTVGGGSTTTSAYVIGNVIVPSATGNTSQPIAVGDGRVGTVHIVNNTFFAPSGTKAIVSVNAAVSSVDFTNNAVYGSLSLVSGTAGPVTGSNEVAPASVSFPASITSVVTLAGAAPAPFAPRPAEAVNAGTTALALPELAPVFELAQPAQGQLQVNARTDGGSTVGASSS